MRLPFLTSYLRLLIIMILVTLLTAGLCIVIIYNVAYKEKKAYLKELCINQLTIIKSINRETKDENKILNILRDQRSNHPGLGDTGEYIIGVLENDSIDFLLDLRRSGYSNIHPMPLNSTSAMPIKKALSRSTGFITGLDYSDTRVLAYYTYIPELKWGLVAKMDISEVNFPFYKAGIYAFLVSMILVLIGTQVFRKNFDPIIADIIHNENRFRNLFDFSAIPIWEVDFSPVKECFNKLKQAGVIDFRAYFEEHKGEVKHLTSLARITDVNQKSVSFFEANNKDEIIKNLLSYFNDDSLEVFKNELAGLAEGVCHFETELPIRTFNGEIKTLLFHMSVMPGHENDLKEVLISFIDFTKRKNAENLLINNQARLNRSQEIAHLGSWEIDVNDRALTWSSEVFRIFGFQPDEFEPTYGAFLEAIHPDDRQIVDDAFTSSVTEGREGYEIEHRIIRKNTGEIRYVREKCYHTKDNSGNIIRSLGMVHDITDSKFLENTQLFLVKAGWIDREEDFFRSLARYLAESFRVDYVRIDRLSDGGMDAESVALYSDGNYLPDFAHSLIGTPGADLSGSTVCFYSGNIRDLYPEDKTLEEVGAEGYAGTILRSSANKPIGYIAMISRKPLKDMQMIESILTLVSIRASGEMERKITEEALRRSEQRLKYHFENSPLAVVEWDTNFCIKNWSKEAERMFGWKAEEVLLRRIDTLNMIFEKDIPKVESTMERLASGKEYTVVSTNRNYTKSGSIIECIWYNSVLLDSNGQMASTMSLIENITERRMAEEALLRSKEDIRTILDATQESMYVFDREGKIITANVTAATRLKCTQNEIIGHHFSEFLPGEIAAIRQSYLNSVFYTGKPVRFEDNRDNYFFENNFFPVLQDDKVTAVVSFSRDITERRKAEEALKKSEAELRELNATKDKFFNIVAHDLKNPFTSLLGSTELLYDSIDLMDKEKIRKLAQILNESAKGGYAILLNLLDWSRSQTGQIKVDPEIINLKNVINLNISEFRLSAINKQITIKSDVNEDLFIYADKNMINTILRNLISNGAKFTRNGGSITVGASSTAENVIISVKDTGVGISAENVRKLFRIETRFQLPGTDNEQGTGLGLKLCKEFVEKLGGMIWVESVENSGSEFKFSIPVRKESGAKE
jgi:PAS domain S-box-containing protein